MKKLLLPLFYLLSLLFLSGKELQAGVVYVKVGGTGDGSSWAAAVGNIQNAINAASSGDMVFVAAGVYDLSAAITLKDGVQLYGSFAGSEASSAQRLRDDKDGNGIIEPWEYVNLTTLMGAAAARILTQENDFSTPTVIDGFAIMNGKADNGGGVSLKGGVTLQACAVRGNTATANGGGAYLDKTTMLGCLVEQNKYGANGGGVYATATSSIHGSKIKDNRSLTSDMSIGQYFGGGVVYSIDEVSRTVQVVYPAASSMAWGGASAWCTGLGAGWALPTSAQLEQMYIVKPLLDNTLGGLPNAQTLGSTACWSSNNAADKAGVVMFDTGYAGNLDKTQTVNVRATRSVTY